MEPRRAAPGPQNLAVSFTSGDPQDMRHAIADSSEGADTGMPHLVYGFAQRQAAVIRSILVPLIITGPLLVAAVAGCAQTAVDDDKPITNEYRTTLIITKPINEKLILFGYYGFAKLPHKETGSVFFSPPNIVYRVNSFTELWLAAVITVSNIKNSSNSWEFRPVAGIKFYVPTKTKLDISVLTRYEDKLVTKDGDTTSTPRFRTRPAIGIPFAKGDRAW